MYKKLIVVFEGIEGSGKSLHIRNVTNYFKKKNIKFIKIREPGGSKSSEKIRKIILSNKSEFNKNTDLLLYMAARSENIEKIINKNYRKKIILIDRFIDSTIAYQHYGMGINLAIINVLNKFLLKDLKVDFTFLNLVNKKNLQIRLSKRKSLNRYDNFKVNFYEKIQSGFIKIARKNRSRYLMIDSNKNIQKNKEIILDKINNLIK